MVFIKKNLTIFGLSLAVFASCTSELRQTRRHLDQGNLTEALEAGRRDRSALREISLHILEQAITEEATQLRAARGLRSAKDLARGTLRKLASQENDVVSSLAAEALVEIGDRDMEELLRGRLDHPEGIVRAAAIRALGVRPDQEETFRGFLNDPDGHVRIVAVSVLSEARDEEFTWVLPALREVAMRDPAEGARTSAIRAISRMDRGSTLLAVIRENLTQDHAITVRMAALEAIASLDDRETAERLLIGALTSGEPEEKIRAAGILAKQGHQMGIEHLTEVLSESSVAYACGAALASGLAGEVMTEALLEALDRPEPEVRLYVAEALIRIGHNERARATLEDFIDYPGRIGLTASTTLIHSFDLVEGPAFDRLRTVLEGEDESLVISALSSCGRIDDGAFLAAIALDNEDPHIRVAAASAVLRSILRDEVLST